MTRVGLCLPVGLEERLADELVHHGHSVGARCSSAGELGEAVESGSCDVAIVAASPRFLTARLLAQADAAGVRMLALVEKESDRRHASELGVLEVATVDSSWTQLEPTLLGSAPAVAGAGPAPGGEHGRVIAVWGPAGSPGRTSIAIAIASELAAAGFSVALADVDTYSGSVAPALGLLDEAPGFAAACRLAGANALAISELERLGERYLSSRGPFRVLTGLGRPGRWPELSGDRVTSVIAQCRDWMQYTVLDTGASLENDEEISSDLFAPRRNAATLAALAAADQVVAIGSADPVGLSRFLRAHVDLVEHLQRDNLLVVMNRVRASAIGLNPAAQVRQSLARFGGIQSPVLVPNDQAALDGAVLSGKTLLDSAPKSPATIAIRELVHERILGVGQPGQSRRRIQRSRSR